MRYPNFVTVPNSTKLTIHLEVLEFFAPAAYPKQSTDPITLPFLTFRLSYFAASLRLPEGQAGTVQECLEHYIFLFPPFPC